MRDLMELGVGTVERSTRSTTARSSSSVRTASSPRYGARPARELEIIDGTCSWVIQEQREIQQLVEEGYTIVLLGTPKHPEVVGLLGYAPDAIVVDEEEDWERIPRRKRMALVTQSTQPPWKFEKLAAFMVGRAHELKIVNTVCPVTIRRQEDTLETAREVDLMVVVGGRTRANTKELTRLCEIAGKPAIQIENARDLADAAPFDGARIVGVTGGTSTPIEDLREVAERIFSSPARTDRAQRRRARRGALDAAAHPAGRTTSLPSAGSAARSLPPMPAPARSRPWPARAACRSSPSSAGRTSARARCSIASSATRERRSSRTGPGRPATGCTATPSGTAAGSSSWTRAAWRSRPATRSRSRSRTRPASRSARRT